MRHEFSKPTKRAKPGAARQWVTDAIASDTDECLPWPFAKLNNGYGQMNHGGKSARVHRVICQIVHGAPPSQSHEAAHNCGNRACANPRHLRWATPQENHADQVAHGTINRGHRHGHVKLTADIVRYARASGKPLTELARTYGVSAATMGDAVRGRTWAWL